MTLPARPLSLVCASVAVLAMASCTTSGHSTKRTDSPSTNAPTSSASTSKSPPPGRNAVNPLTGIGPVPRTALIAVKIDDTAPGRPQRGIDHADIVYIEAAEGGLTRLAAIFGTHKPLVGYVRSTRPSDPELLLQFGKITEAYSGGAHDSLPLVRKSGITSWSNDAGAPYYSRVNRSQSSYINLVLNLTKVAASVKTPAPRSIGWRFNASLAGLPSRTGRQVKTTVTGSYSSGTGVEFRYNAALKKYVRYIGGVMQRAADGQPVATTNVVVQSCRVVAHPADTDVNGNPSQFTYTVGKGKVSVFRQGRRIDGTWSRSSVKGGTNLRTTSGKLLPLDPGNTWVVLIRNGVSIMS